MNQLVQLSEGLNDLIRINNDRITGYEKAAMTSRTISADIKNVFHHLALKSRKYARPLALEVINSCCRSIPILVQGNILIQQQSQMNSYDLSIRYRKGLFP